MFVQDDKKVYTQSTFLVGGRDLPSAYNSILGGPKLNRIGAGLSTLHLVKLPLRALILSLFAVPS